MDTVDAARKKLNAHRPGPDIERDLSKLMELISDLKVAQKMEMPESQKYEVLRVLIPHEWRVHVKKVVGIASRKFKKSGMRYWRKRTMSRSQQQRKQQPWTEFVLSSKQMSVPERVAHSSTRL